LVIVACHDTSPCSERPDLGQQKTRRAGRLWRARRVLVQDRCAKLRHRHTLRAHHGWDVRRDCRRNHDSGDRCSRRRRCQYRCLIRAHNRPLSQRWHRFPSLQLYVYRKQRRPSLIGFRGSPSAPIAQPVTPPTQASMHQPFSTTHVPWRARLPWLSGTRNRRFRRLERSQPVPSTGKPNGGTAVLFESGTTSSNPSSSSEESIGNVIFGDSSRTETRFEGGDALASRRHQHSRQPRVRRASPIPSTRCRAGSRSLSGLRDCGPARHATPLRYAAPSPQIQITWTSHPPQPSKTSCRGWASPASASTDRPESRSLDRSVIPAFRKGVGRSLGPPPRSRSRGTSRSSVRDCRSRAKARCHGHPERGKIVP
jgi:hypothetical protein